MVQAPMTRINKPSFGSFAQSVVGNIIEPIRSFVLIVGRLGNKKLLIWENVVDVVAPKNQVRSFVIIVAKGLELESRGEFSLLCL